MYICGHCAFHYCLVAPVMTFQCRTYVCAEYSVTEGPPQEGVHIWQHHQSVDDNIHRVLYFVLNSFQLQMSAYKAL